MLTLVLRLNIIVFILIRKPPKTKIVSGIKMVYQSSIYLDILILIMNYINSLSHITCINVC